MTDPINHPAHYTSGPRCECGRTIECITVTEGMSFCRGNAVKYLWRAGLKDDELADLRKAAWYVAREIARVEAEQRVPLVRSIVSATGWSPPFPDARWHE